MIYNGLGTGSAVKRNKIRVEYVKELSKDTIHNLVEEFFNVLEIASGDEEQFYVLDEIVKDLFYENIDVEKLLDILEIYEEIRNIDELKKNIIINCIEQPKKGFIWNMYEEFLKIGELSWV